MANMMRQISKVVLGNGVHRGMLGSLGLPEGVPDISVNENDLSGWWKTVLAIQEDGHPLVATNSEQIAALSRSINLNLTKNKLALWYNGTTEITDMSRELVKKMLYSADKTEYLPEPMPVAGVFQAENRVLIRTVKVPQNADILYTHDGKPWGIMLSPTLQADSYAGTLQELLPAMTENVRASLLPMLVGRGETCASADSILLFRQSDGYCAFSLPDAKTVPTDTLALHIMTGLSPDASADVILLTLSRLDHAEIAAQLGARFCMRALFA